MRPGPNPPREKDDLVLEFLRLRARAVSVYTIADRFKFSPSYVEQVTASVRAADLKESGEPIVNVDCAYWKKRARK